MGEEARRISLIFPVPFSFRTVPCGDSAAVDRTSVDARRTYFQLRIKDRRDEEVEADVVAAIALGRLYQAIAINDYRRLWRSSIRRICPFGAGRACKPPISMPSARQACGWAFRHMIDMEIDVASTPSLYRAGTCVPDANQTDAFNVAGPEQLARHVETGDYPTVAIGVPSGTRLR